MKKDLHILGIVLFILFIYMIYHLGIRFYTFQHLYSIENFATKKRSSAKPTPAPVKPTVTPVKPTPAPVKPAPAPVKPAPAPVKPAPAPVKPAPAPAPVKPAPAPVKPAPAPVKPAPAKITPSPSIASVPVSKPEVILATQNMGFDTCDIKMDEWGGNPEEIQKQKEGLTKKQQCEVKNLLKQFVRTNVMEALSAQNPIMTGPVGPAGPAGPAGSKFMASGRLLNQIGSFGKNQSTVPVRVATRTSGTSETSSLVYMETPTPFVSYQDWIYNDKNQITNRYDGTCLTYKDGQEKVYMGECNEQNMKQKWIWDKSNRFISLDPTATQKNKIKCLSISSPNTDPLMSSLPDCVGDKCKNKENLQYVIIKDCNPSEIQSNEIFGFQ
jgi:hypothetical protein